MKEEEDCVAVFLARGSLGDVLPLVALALQLIQSGKWVCTVVCEATVAEALSHSIVSVRNKTLAMRHLRDLRPSSERPPKDVDRISLEEMLDAHSSVQQCNPDVLVHNLFALDGFSIAESLQIPVVVVSPFVLTRTPPPGFMEQFQAELGDIHAHLALPTHPDAPNLAELQHWLWRLYLDDHGEFRDRLHLPTCPYDTTPPLPPTPPLLYAISPLVVDSTPWPKSIRAIGYCALATSEWDQCPAHVLEWVRSRKCHVLYVGFGSMETIGFAVPPGVPSAVCRAAEGLGLAVVLHADTAASPFAQEASCHATAHPEVCHFVSGLVPHASLLEHCAIALHHGGAGTVGAALSRGIPQIVAPFHFDQHSWGKCLRQLGVAPEAVDLLELAQVRIVAHRLAHCLSPAVIARARELGAQVRSENGTIVAARQIQSVLHSLNDKS